MEAIKITNAVRTGTERIEEAYARALEGPQSDLKRSGKDLRRANILHKRAAAASFADQEILRREPARKQRAAIASEVWKLEAEAKEKAAADPGNKALQNDYEEGRAAARAVTRNLARLQDAADALPLYAIRTVKHDVEKGSRAIRRKVSHDARKGRKPVAGNKGGSVGLDASDLILLHGRFAANVLSTEDYNAALAELHALGRLRHLDPLLPKAEAEVVTETDERRAA